MRYLSILWLILATACTLTTTSPLVPATPINLNDVLDATDEPVVIVTQTVTSQAVTATVTQTTTANVTPVTQTGQNISSCVPRGDWAYRYTVQPGDTLSKIAQRGNTTAAALAAGNCLVSADVIAVGQVLRTPNPVSASLPPTVVPNPGGQQGTVYISSYISADAGNYFLLRDETITLRWDNPPANLYRATFVIQTPGSGVITQIGEDVNPADGITTQFTVPGGLHGNLMAQGRFLNSNAVVTSFPSSISAASPQGLGCELTAAPGTTIAAYGQPNYNSGVFLTIPAGDYMEMLGRSLNGWFAVMPLGISPYTAANLRWIPVTQNLRGRGNCPPDVPLDVGLPEDYTYTNADIGFKLDYPPGWTQQASGNTVSFIAPDGRALEILFGEVNSGRSPAQEAAACLESPLCIGDRLILGQQAVTLPDGLPGYRLELSASPTKPDTVPAVYVFTVINNHSLVFRGFSQSPPTFFDTALNTLYLLRF
jgi:LysM repeat protein